MNGDHIAERIYELSVLLLDNVLTQCERIGIEPRVERGLEGTYVLDAHGKALAALRISIDERKGLVARVEVRCKRLRAAMAHGEKVESVRLTG